MCYGCVISSWVHCIDDRVDESHDNDDRDDDDENYLDNNDDDGDGDDHSDEDDAIPHGCFIVSCNFAVDITTIQGESGKDGNSPHLTSKIESGLRPMLQILAFSTVSI